MFMQITNSRKKQRHTIRKFVFRENNFYQLIDTLKSISLQIFRLKPKSHCVSHLFPQSLVLSLLSLNSHVLCDVF